MQAIFTSMGRRQAARLNTRIGERPVADRVAALTTMLRDSGVAAESEETAGGFLIREHNCPYAKSVGEHPEICSVIHSVMQEVVAPHVTQTDSLATGGAECRFEITTNNDRADAPAGPIQESV